MVHGMLVKDPLQFCSKRGTQPAHWPLVHNLRKIHEDLKDNAEV